MLEDKIKTLSELQKIRGQLKANDMKVVFTNGVFDLIHRGHVEYLEAAKALGDVLILGLNSDQSVKKIKGPFKPVVNEEDRAVVLAALSSIDYVCLFDEETPNRIICTLIPDILVKGGDYQYHEIVGREVVEENGGRVITIPFTAGKSTTNLMREIARHFKNEELAE